MTGVPCLRVVGKGRKERALPLWKAAADGLARPPSVVSSLWRREPFPGRDSGQFPHSRRLSQFLFEPVT